MQNPTSPSHGEGFQRSGSERPLAWPATIRQGRSVCALRAQRVAFLKE